MAVGSKSVKWNTTNGGAADEGLPTMSSGLERTTSSLATHANQIVAGVVLKYVNLAQGWRHRLLVLEDDTVRYWKLQGPEAVDVYKLLGSLREKGELQVVGLEALALETRWRNVTIPDAPLAAPTSEIHLKVAKVKESKSDPRKFKINTGVNKVFYFRAEDREERWKWVSSFQNAQTAWAKLNRHVTRALTITPTDAEFRAAADTQAQRAFVDEVRANLQRLGAPEGAVAYVETALAQRHKEYLAVLEDEVSKRSTLAEVASQLSDQKRELEQQLALPNASRNVQLTLRARRSGNSTSGELDNDVRSFLNETPEPEASEGVGDDGAVAYSDLESDADEFLDAEAKQRWLERSSVNSTASSVSRAAAEEVSAPSTALGKVAGDMGAVVAKRPMPDWVKAELPAPKRRSRLPPPSQKERPVSLWAIIKEMVGKDLTRVCLPVYFNEPLSALQKIAEDLEYTELLDAAAACPKGSVERLVWLSAFAVSGYSGTSGRTNKPFNPLLGETYELVHAEKGVRFLAEKVVHHPTVIAAYVEGRGWTIEGDADVKSKFWGRSIELIPEGVLVVTFHDGERYQWSKVTTYINNLILGKIYVDHGGVMKLTCAETGLVARLRFKEAGMFYDKNPRQVKGTFERNKEKLERPTISGTWDGSLSAEMPDGSRLHLWSKAPPAADPTRYNLSTWAIQLNELTPELQEKLAPTDCRLRPDQHHLELGEYDQANAEKQRLEEKQRAARRAAERGEPIKPRWFEQVPGVKSGRELMFKYKGGYWEQREAGHFTGCRDIFGLNVPS